MVVILMHSGYQNQLDFTIEQAGIVFKFEGIVFRKEARADGNLCAVEILAPEGDHEVHEVGLDEGAADARWLAVPLFIQVLPANSLSLNPSV